MHLKGTIGALPPPPAANVTVPSTSNPGDPADTGAPSLPPLNFSNFFEELSKRSPASSPPVVVPINPSDIQSIPSDRLKSTSASPYQSKFPSPPASVLKTPEHSVTPQPTRGSSARLVVPSIKHEHQTVFSLNIQQGGKRVVAGRSNYLLQTDDYRQSADMSSWSGSTAYTPRSPLSEPMPSPLADEPPPLPKKDRVGVMHVSAPPTGAPMDHGTTELWSHALMALGVGGDPGPIDGRRRHSAASNQIRFRRVSMQNVNEGPGDAEEEGVVLPLPPEEEAKARKVRRARSLPRLLTEPPMRTSSLAHLERSSRSPTSAGAPGSLSENVDAPPTPSSIVAQVKTPTSPTHPNDPALMIHRELRKVKSFQILGEEMPAPPRVSSMTHFHRLSGSSPQMGPSSSGQESVLAPQNSPSLLLPAPMQLHHRKGAMSLELPRGRLSPQLGSAGSPGSASSIRPSPTIWKRPNLEDLETQPYHRGLYIQHSSDGSSSGSGSGMFMRSSSRGSSIARSISGSEILERRKSLDVRMLFKLGRRGTSGGTASAPTTPPMGERLAPPPQQGRRGSGSFEAIQSRIRKMTAVFDPLKRRTPAGGLHLQRRRNEGGEWWHGESELHRPASWRDHERAASLMEVSAEDWRKYKQQQQYADGGGGGESALGLRRTSLGKPESLMFGPEAEKWFSDPQWDHDPSTPSETAATAGLSDPDARRASRNFSGGRTPSFTSSLNSSLRSIGVDPPDVAVRAPPNHNPDGRRSSYSSHITSSPVPLKRTDTWSEGIPSPPRSPAKRPTGEFGIGLHRAHSDELDLASPSKTAADFAASPTIETAPMEVKMTRSASAGYLAGIKSAVKPTPPSPPVRVRGVRNTGRKASVGGANVYGLGESAGGEDKGEPGVGKLYAKHRRSMQEIRTKRRASMASLSAAVASGSGSPRGRGVAKFMKGWRRSMSAVGLRTSKEGGEARGNEGVWMYRDLDGFEAFVEERKKRRRRRRRAKEREMRDRLELLGRVGGIHDEGGVAVGLDADGHLMVQTVTELATAIQRERAQFTIYAEEDEGDVGGEDLDDDDEEDDDVAFGPDDPSLEERWGWKPIVVIQKRDNRFVLAPDEVDDNENRNEEGLRSDGVESADATLQSQQQSAGTPRVSFVAFASSPFVMSPGSGRSPRMSTNRFERGEGRSEGWGDEQRSGLKEALKKVFAAV
ncbi:hypothetical protein BJ742DRAFT_292471 [Cladochytrium replicatum]|nr:hypothetical protein BJ742DRAFT_292471 [Cladochytrium replicatum]